jgi:biotin transporter BioY
MLGILVAVLAAVLSYVLCVAVGLPSVVGLAAAILILVALAPTGGYGVDDRPWSGRTRS